MFANNIRSKDTSTLCFKSCSRFHAAILHGFDVKLQPAIDRWCFLYPQLEIQASDGDQEREYTGCFEGPEKTLEVGSV